MLNFSNHKKTTTLLGLVSLALPILLFSCATNPKALIYDRFIYQSISDNKEIIYIDASSSRSQVYINGISAKDDELVQYQAANRALDRNKDYFAISARSDRRSIESKVYSRDREEPYEDTGVRAFRTYKDYKVVYLSELELTKLIHQQNPILEIIKSNYQGQYENQFENVKQSGILKIEGELYRHSSTQKLINEFQTRFGNANDNINYIIDIPN